MKPSSRALIWAFWRKNRWGFVLLFLLLLGCGAGGAYVGHLQAMVNRAGRELAASLRGNVSLRDLLPKSGASPVDSTGRIKFGNHVVYDGPFSPTDSVSWTAEGFDPVYPTLQILLNGQPQSSPTPLQPQLTISISGGSKRTVSFAPAYDAHGRLLLSAAQADGWRSTFYYTSLVAIAFSVLAVFGIFGFAEPHNTRGFTGMPPRLFTLPISSGALVQWPIVLGVATMLLITWLWFGAVLPLVRVSPLPSGYFVVLFTAALLVFQSIVWSLPSFPKTRVALLTGFMLVLVLVATLPFEAPDPAEHPEWSRFQLAVELACLLIGAVSVGLAVVGVRLERQGRWASHPRSSRLPGLFRSLGPKPAAFPSALQAQFWMEWRRNGRLALVLWTGLASLILVTSVWTQVFSPDWRWLVEGLLTAGTILAICWVVLIGLNLGRDAATKRLAMSSFVASRPMATDQLLTAKLLVGLFLWLAASLIACSLWFLTQAASGRMDQFSDSSWLLLVLMAVSLHMAVGVLPLCLSGRIPGFPWSLVPFLIIYGTIANVLIRLGEHPDAVHWLFPVLMLLLGIKLVCAFWAFGAAIRRRFASSLFVLLYASFWLLAAGGLVLVAWNFYLDHVERGGDSLAVLPAAALIVPLARIALCPLALNWNRHR